MKDRLHHKIETNGEIERVHFLTPFKDINNKKWHKSDLIKANQTWLMQYLPHVPGGHIISDKSDNLQQ